MVTVVTRDNSRGWTVKHPTVLDAIARLVIDDPELLDLYVMGAPIGRLLAEITAGASTLRGFRLSYIRTGTKR